MPADSSPAVYLLATLDTKGREADYVRRRLAALGVRCRLVDVGTLAPPQAVPDIAREVVLAAAGATSEVDVAGSAGPDRGRSVAAAARGAAALVADHFRQGLVAGVLGIGGSAGTTIGTAAMRALPLGVPKVMLSTLASGQVRHFVGDKDIFLLNSIVDLAGLNRVSRQVLDQAARTMAGLVGLPADAPTEGERPLVAATMFGVTTACVERARTALDAAGYEVLVFHATGNGGQAMESLIRDGLVAGVLDITTTELADELAGGVLSAGSARLTAAAEMGVPQVVSVGALDMINFHAPETVPERFAGRLFYRHNPHVTLMRTTPAENTALGSEIGGKLAAAQGPAEILFPLRGVSAIDRAGQPFDDPVARQALLSALRATCGGAALVEIDAHINDPEFADAAAARLIALMRA